MNLKKLGLPVLCCGAGLLTSCGYTYKTTKTIYYDDAKKWVEENCKNNSKTQTFPSSIESNWAMHGRISEYLDKSRPITTRQNIRDHMKIIFSSLSFCSEDIVDNTYKDGGNADEFAYLTNETIIVESPTDPTYFMTLNDTNFDSVMDFYYQGYAKNMCYYTIDSKTKKLVVEGNFTRDYKFDNGSHSFYKIPSCSLTFNSNGTIDTIKFDFKNEETVRFYYLTTTGGEGWAFEVTPTSYFEFKYVY